MATSCRTSPRCPARRLSANPLPDVRLRALNGLDDRAAGTVPSFNYSDANRKSGVVWNEETFKEYVKYPRAFVRGTKMTFPGLKNQQQINDLWAYVKQFDSSGNIKK